MARPTKVVTKADRRRRREGQTEIRGKAEEGQTRWVRKTRKEGDKKKERQPRMEQRGERKRERRRGRRRERRRDGEWYDLGRVRREEEEGECGKGEEGREVDGR